MKTIIKVFKLHMVFVIIFGVLYPALIWAFAQAVPQKANGVPLYSHGRLRGFKGIGEKFISPRYFQGRPSAADYNPCASGGSNMGPTNPVYINMVRDRMEILCKQNPGHTKSDIPIDLLTASGSGLDPDISPASARFQIPRIARERKINSHLLMELVKKNTETPFLGLFGLERVNVLMLNLSLDKISK